jgi:GNAT superfamily N-acetyltransferase
MRGQKLFIRPVVPADRDAIDSFLSSEGHPLATSELGLLGKLVGNLVAVVSLQVDGDALRVTDLIVARELRRKRIGRYMLAEAALLAGKMHARGLVADDRADAAEFLRRVGFVEEEGRMVRWLDG